MFLERDFVSLTTVLANRHNATMLIARDLWRFRMRH
jgi:hypothetical protein